MRASLFVLLLLAGTASAQVRTADLVDWRVRADRTTAGGDARIVLDATIQPGWRLYAIGSTVGIPLTITVDEAPEIFRIGEIQQGEPREAFDEGFQETYPYFAGRARVVVPLAVRADAPLGTHEARGSVRYTVCDDSICLPPARSAFRVPIVVQR